MANVPKIRVTRIHQKLTVLGSWKGNSSFSASFCCCWTFSNCCCCFCWRIKSLFFSSAAVKSNPSVLIFDVERLKFIFKVIKQELRLVAMASDKGQARSDKISDKFHNFCDFNSILLQSLSLYLELLTLF